MELDKKNRAASCAALLSYLGVGGGVRTHDLQIHNLAL